MEKKLLTLQELFMFYNEHFSSNISFDAKDNGGKPIVVHADNIASFEDVKTDEGLMFLKFKVCHIDVNRNGSRISRENMTKAMPSLKYRPVLAYIKEDSNGELDFDAHNMTINEDGSVDYLESQVGSFTVDEPVLKYDPEQDKTYVIAYAAIPIDYTKTADILSRKNGTKCSCELCINAMSYDAKDKVLDLTDFYFNAVTLLGEDIGEGMKGSRADIVSLEDFSIENNSCTFNQANVLKDVIKKLEEIDYKLSNLNINPSNEEGGNGSVKLNELLEKYNKTVEELGFDYENMTDEELEAKFEEVFSTSDEPNENNFSITLGDSTYSFEVSLNDKLKALDSLVNSTYSEQDNTYYCVKVFDNYVVMIDFWNDRAFKQSYTCSEDVYTLSGDRVEVYCTYLTREEEAAVDDMRAKYSELETELNTYKENEAAEKKKAIYDSEDYDCLRDSEDFTNLINDSKNYTVEEFQHQCDELLLKYAKTNKIFSSTPEKKKVRVGIGAKKEPSYSPYGNLFANKE